RFGKARTTLKGGGGSGEPTTREVVQGLRTDLPGWGSLDWGGSAAGEASHAKRAVPSRSGNGDRVMARRRPPREGDGMGSTPDYLEAVLLCRNPSPKRQRGGPTFMEIGPPRWRLGLGFRQSKAVSELPLPARSASKGHPCSRCGL